MDPYKLHVSLHISHAPVTPSWHEPRRVCEVTGADGLQDGRLSFSAILPTNVSDLLSKDTHELLPHLPIRVRVRVRVSK